MQTLHPSFTWVVAGISLGALGLMLHIALPFAAKAQEPKTFQWLI